MNLAGRWLERKAAFFLSSFCAIRKYATKKLGLLEEHFNIDLTISKYVIFLHVLFSPFWMKP